ncbi:MAG: hypothetical protein NTZ59_02430 [Bacteroidetes bacterium]|nr:hypothetical protein [Bacteroidota bacterium]
MTPQEIVVANLPHLNFGNATGFADEAANMSERVFSVTVTNATTAQHVVSLFPSYFPENAKQLVEGEINGIEGLEATVNGSVSIAQFKAAIARYPTRVLRLQVESTNRNALSKVLTLQEKDHFQKPAPRTINFSSFKSTTANDREMIIVKTPFQLDGATEISYPIAARVSSDTPTEVTFIFYCGAFYDEEMALDRLAEAAYSDLATRTIAQNYINA